MRCDIEERTVQIAMYMLAQKCTVREAAKHFGVSKSNVHKDMTERLRYIHPGLFSQVKALLETNKSERHLRGGEATRIKYLERQKAGA